MGLCDWLLEHNARLGRAYAQRLWVRTWRAFLLGAGEDLVLFQHVVGRVGLHHRLRGRLFPLLRVPGLLHILHSHLGSGLSWKKRVRRSRTHVRAGRNFTLF